MPVYVDRIEQHVKIKPAARKFGSLWCHMYADSLEELNEMADRIGLKRNWVQRGGYKKMLHYDLVPSKRELALQHGAIDDSNHKEWRRIWLEL